MRIKKEPKVPDLDELKVRITVNLIDICDGVKTTFDTLITEIEKEVKRYNVGRSTVNIISVPTKSEIIDRVRFISTCDCYESNSMELEIYCNYSKEAKEVRYNNYLAKKKEYDDWYFCHETLIKEELDRRIKVARDKKLKEEEKLQEQIEKCKSDLQMLEKERAKLNKKKR